jgi:D-alanyl-D-alanine carboxypeptidase/D-alanyl-D-alanine-endopeptidase (penicillin-binding protein 4)
MQQTTSKTNPVKATWYALVKASISSSASVSSKRRKLAVAALATLFLSSASTAPTYSWHGHHRHASSHVVKREDATKHKLHGVRQSVIEGYIIQDENGEVLQSNNADVLFNPASCLKLATSYMVLSKYGANGTFPTEAYVSGPIDDKGVVQGNLYVIGGNPLFSSAQAEQLVKSLNEKGINSVKGDLIVSKDFQLNLGASGDEAARQLRGIMEGHAVVRRNRHKRAVVYSASHVHITGRTKSGELPAESTLVTTHESPKLHDILKVMLCYSHNGMAESLGNMMGGPKAVADFIVEDLGVNKDEVKFSSCSGLGVNRITPKAMSRVLVALRDELKDHDMALTDILPVAGIDPGTLEHRFTAAASRGTVVAKTGTLPDTDRGVSALAGEMKTQKDGTLTFVIFEQHGSVNNFRRRQEELVSMVQRDHGGPSKFDYDQKALIAHLHH